MPSRTRLIMMRKRWYLWLCSIWDLSNTLSYGFPNSLNHAECVQNVSIYWPGYSVYPLKVDLNWLQVGADIVKRALSYPLKLIAKNAGVNGSVVSEKVYWLYNQWVSRRSMISVSWCICVDQMGAFSGALQWQSKIWVQCCNRKIWRSNGCWNNWPY